MKIHLVQMSHTDIGYTDSQERIREAYAAFLDEALTLTERYRHYPEGSRFRWTVETGWALRQFVERRPERVFTLVKAVREGFIELTGAYCHFTDAIDPFLLEHSTHWMKDFLNQHELSVSVATHNDINGYSSALPGVLNRMGVKHLAMGMNHTLALGLGKRHRAARWTALDGESILVWHGDHYNLGNWMGLSARNMSDIFGRPTWPYEGPKDTANDLYPEAVENTRTLLDSLQLQNYPWNNLLIQCAGLQADNSPPDAVMCDIVRRFNEEQPLGEEVQIHISSLTDFFKDLDEDIQANPAPVEDWAGAWPDYWALGLGPAPDEMRAVRRAQTLLPAVRELTGAEDPGYVEATEKAMLALEHTFGSYDSVTGHHGANAQQQWCLKRETFYRAEHLCDLAIERHELHRSREIGRQPDEALMMNPLGTRGDQYGIIQIPDALIQETPPCLILDGKNHPLQQLSRYDLNYGRHNLGGHWMFRLDLQDEVEARASIAPDQKITSVRNDSKSPVLENPWIRLELDPDEIGIRSLVDRTSGRELVLADSPPLGALVHADHLDVQRPPGPVDHDAESAGSAPTPSSLDPNTPVEWARSKKPVILSNSKGPLFDEITVKGELPSYDCIQCRVRLYHADGCVELIYEGIKSWLNKPNADHVLFGANLTPPRFLLEASGGLFEPGVQQVPQSCLDFFTVQHTAVLHDEEYALTLDPVDTPLMQIGQPTLFGWLREIQNPSPVLVSNLYNNLWFTNYPALHAGPLTARFVFKPGPLKDLELTRKAIHSCAHRPLMGYAGEKRLPMPGIGQSA